MFLPHEGVGFWPLISMGAILGGTMRSPFTGILFAFELTHDVNVLLPLLVACFLAHGFTVLTLKRSILTEKVARRGFHLSREYAVDPLEILFARDVMRTNIVALPSQTTLGEVGSSLHMGNERKSQLLYPVVDQDGILRGTVTRNTLQQLLQSEPPAETRLSEVAGKDPVVAYADEPLRMIVNRMAETGYTRFPVIDRENGGKLVGMVALHDLLHARSRALDDEGVRERVLRIHLPFGSRRTIVETRSV